MDISLKGAGFKNANITNDIITIGKKEINISDVIEIKYRLGNWSGNGFLVFCTEDHKVEVEKIEDIIWDKNSIQFRKNQNEIAEDILERFKDKVIITNVNEELKDKREEQKQKERELKNSDEIHCPKCLSTKIQAGEKGFGAGKATAGALVAGPLGLLAGTIGRKKVELMCLNCGNRWKPNKK